MNKVLMFALFGFAMANADTIYTYNGPDFQTVSGTGGPTTSDHINITFDLASALPDDVINFPFEEFGFTPISWTISDGVNTLSSNHTGDYINDPFITTDAAGDVTGWVFYAGQLNSNPLLGNLISINTESDGGGAGEFSYTYLGPYGIYSPPTTTAIYDGPNNGNWTITNTSAVPEPGKVPLLVVALLMCVAFVKSRRRRRSHN